MAALAPRRAGSRPRPRPAKVRQPMPALALPTVAVTPNERRWLLLGFLVYLGVALSGLAVASQSQQMRELVMSMEASQRQEDEMLAEQSRLLLERSTLASFQQVDQIAETQLQMQFPEAVEKVRR